MPRLRQNILQAKGGKTIMNKSLRTPLIASIIGVSLLTLTFVLQAAYPNNITVWNIVGLTGFGGGLSMFVSLGMTIMLIIKKKFLD